MSFSCLLEHLVTDRRYTLSAVRYSMLVLGLAIGNPHIAADVVITNQHTDLTVRWDGSNWDPHYIVDFERIELAGTSIRVALSSRSFLSSDPFFAFTGAGPGQPLWLLPEVNDPDAPFLGIAGFGSGLSSPIALRLTGVEGPGQVSLRNSTLPGQAPNVHFASSDGIDSTDEFMLPSSGHSHFNWGFTDAGHYRIELAATAQRTLGSLTPVGNFAMNFQVVGIPEPSSATLLGGATSLCLLRRRSRRRLCPADWSH